MLTCTCGAAQANAEKLRLEMKQRAARKAAEQGEPIRPRWFTPVPGTQAAGSDTCRTSLSCTCDGAAVQGSARVKSTVSIIHFAVKPCFASRPSISSCYSAGAVVGRDQAYKYHGGYFEAREKGNWAGVRDIFGPDIPDVDTAATVQRQ